MSSVPITSLWRSTSLRWSVLLTLVLWFLTMSVAIGVAERTEQVLVAAPSESARELERAFYEALQGERFAHGKLMAEAFVGAVAPLQLDAEVPFPVALTRYQRALTQRLAVAEGRERQELVARQWLLGEPVLLEVGEEPVDAYIELLEAEFPERLHEPLMASLEQRRAAWPAQTSWLSLSAPEKVRLVSERLLQQAVADDEPWCLALAQPSGELVLHNVELLEELSSERPDFRVFRVSQAQRLRSNPEYCWARVVALEDHSEVLLGVRVTEAFGAVLALRDQLGGGFVVTFLLSVLIGGFLGYRIHRRLRVLNETVGRVRDGALDERIVVRSKGDDFDRLGGNINAMLDRLQALMAGVRAVSDNIAHDLKTPLTRLHHQIEFLAQQDPPSTEGVSRVAEEADRLLGTLTALLRIAQLEQGTLRQPTVRFDLGMLVRDVVELYEPAFAEVSMTLQLELPPGPVWVTGDRQLWSQALSNLLENSLTHAAQGDRVTLSVEAGASAPTLEVADNGPGIPEHDFERVFERFYRADRARSKPGTGLGLSLVRAIAEAHDVRIELANRDGLVVRFYWPASSETPGGVNDGD